MRIAFGENQRSLKAKRKEKGKSNKIQTKTNK